MYIQEAIVAADNNPVTRKSWNGSLKVYPTNFDLGCLLVAPSMKPGARWQPHKEDLIANDWEVVKA